MTNHVPFVDQDISSGNRVTASWLNGVNNNAYQANAGSAGVTSAMYKTVQEVFVNYVNVQTWMTAAQITDARSGSPTLDSSAAFALAMSAGGSAATIVVVPGQFGEVYLLTSQLVVGGSAILAHGLVGLGRPTLKFNIASHSTDCLVLQGYNQGVVGRQFYPTLLSNFDIYCQNTGRDGVVQKESDHCVRESITVVQPYRNAYTHAPTTNCWIENGYSRDLLADKCGQHGFYFYTTTNTFINDCTWINCEVRGVAINSVTLGIDKTTQQTQLGTAIYVISKSNSTGGIDGHTWTAFTADSASSLAVANSSAPNPDAVFFADGRNTQVIEGVGVVGANRTFIQWRFLTPRIEDTAAGGFTTGSAFARESTSVSCTNLWIDALSGGNWGSMTFTPNLADDGTYVGSADYAGSIRRIRWNGSFEFNGSLAVSGTNIAALTASGVGSVMQIQKVKGASYGNIVQGAAANITSFGTNTAGMLVIEGNNGASDAFCDVQVFRWFGDSGLGSVIKKDTLGSPPTRTYTIDGGTGEVHLALGAGTGTFAITTSFVLPLAATI